jgi:hypothetical protein
MQWSDISFTPSSRTLRQFAGIWLGFFLAVACWQWLRHDNVVLAWVFAGLAATVGPLGLARPQAIRLIFVGATIVTFPIGWVLSKVLLSVLYFGLFTPVAVLFRLIGRDVLRLNRPECATYWSVKAPATDPARYFRQY